MWGSVAPVSCLLTGTLPTAQTPTPHLFPELLPECPSQGLRQKRSFGSGGWPWSLWAVAHHCGTSCSAAVGSPRPPGRTGWPPCPRARPVALCTRGPPASLQEERGQGWEPAARPAFTRAHPECCSTAGNPAPAGTPAFPVPLACEGRGRSSTSLPAPGLLLSKALLAQPPWVLPHPQGHGSGKKGSWLFPPADTEPRARGLQCACTPTLHGQLDDDLVDLLAVVPSNHLTAVKGRVCPGHVPDLQRRLPQQLCTVGEVSCGEERHWGTPYRCLAPPKASPLKEKTSHPALKDKEHFTDSAAITGYPHARATWTSTLQPTPYTTHTYCMSYNSNP